MDSKHYWALERLREQYLQRAAHARKVIRECPNKDAELIYRGQNAAYQMASRLLTLLINRGVE